MNKELLVTLKINSHEDQAAIVSILVFAGYTVAVRDEKRVHYSYEQDHYVDVFQNKIEDD
jgi:hypothetical protein